MKSKLVAALLCASVSLGSFARAQGDDPDPAGPQGGPATQVTQRAEPAAQAPANPLEMSPEVRERIGTDSDHKPPSPEGALERKFFPLYEERKGDYRFRFLPPFYLEHSRGLADPAHPALKVSEDTETLWALLFYQRRSDKLDADVLFPLAWKIRERENHVLVLGPLAHREAPNEHDNWVAPLVFEGKRLESGYLHVPLLLSSTHYSKEAAFTVSGPFFRDRTGTDVDMGVVPFFFHGNNGSMDGNERAYTLIPPLLFYHRYRELEESHLTVVGPLIFKSDPKRSIFDVAPIFFHIEGKPETGGVREQHTTIFPLFHYGKSPDASLFVVPGYLRRVTRTADTLITPFFTSAYTRNESTHFTAIGPLLPLFYNYTDRDIGLHAFAVAPFYYQSDSPKGHDFLTPLYGKFESYGVSRTWWTFPSIVVSKDNHGWETDVHPLVYLGRNDSASHTVLAPVFWDFTSLHGRTTVGFPVFWRFSTNADDSIIQVAGNTLYMQKRAVGGSDWQFHVLPLFSYGEDPQGYFWNVLFGLAGYQRQGSYARVKAFWIPIQTSGPATPAPQQAAWAR